MKMQVTKTMANYIKKFVKENKLAEEVEYVHVSGYEYPMKYADGEEVDYDEDTDEYRVIKVFYPYEYYAPACIISTPLLMQRLKSEGYELGGTISKEVFDDMLRDIIEI